MLILAGIARDFCFAVHSRALRSALSFGLYCPYLRPASSRPPHPKTPMDPYLTQLATLQAEDSLQSALNFVGLDQQWEHYLLDTLGCEATKRASVLGLIKPDAWAGLTAVPPSTSPAPKAFVLAQFVQVGRLCRLIAGSEKTEAAQTLAAENVRAAANAALEAQLEAVSLLTKQATALCASLAAAASSTGGGPSVALGSSGSTAGGVGLLP